MTDEPSKTLQDLVRHVGQYPEQAFLFIREGLAFTVEQLHGPENDAHRFLFRYITENGLDWSELVARKDEGTLPEEVVQAIEAAGGGEKLNRHVSGRELCWGLREYALRRWGMLARTVLESWSIKTTTDFGRIVFGFIDLELMQKQLNDAIEDFQEVFDFEEAFDETFRSGLAQAEEDEESD